MYLRVSTSVPAQVSARASLLRFRARASVATRAVTPRFAIQQVTDSIPLAGSILACSIACLFEHPPTALPDRGIRRIRRQVEIAGETVGEADRQAVRADRFDVHDLGLVHGLTPRVRFVSAARDSTLAQREGCRASPRSRAAAHDAVPGTGHFLLGHGVAVPT